LQPLSYSTVVACTGRWVESGGLGILSPLLCYSLPLFVSSLTIVGGILARNYASPDFQAPTRTTKVAREIPTEVPWYRGKPFQLIIVACFPFSAMCIEMHYIFASIWGHQIYTLFGIVFFTFMLLIIVTSFITIALLYF